MNPIIQSKLSASIKTKFINFYNKNDRQDSNRQFFS